MKAIALIALAVALEAGFLFTLALPAAGLDAARPAVGARALVARSPAPSTVRPGAAPTARPTPSRS